MEYFVHFLLDQILQMDNLLQYHLDYKRATVKPTRYLPYTQFLGIRFAKGGNIIECVICNASVVYNYIVSYINCVIIMS